MLKLAIIGTGYWGPNFAKLIVENPNTQLHWCCDISKDNLEKFRKKYKDSKYLKTTYNIDDVLKDESIDAVVVTVPADQHYSVSKAVLLSDKHLLVEKPLTTNTKQAKELVKIAKERDLVLLVDHIYLFNPAIRKVRELINNKDLGSIYYSHGDYTALGPIRVDVSAMTDLAIHFIYTICYLLDSKPTSISAYGKSILTPDNTDVAFINLEFGKKAIFNLRVSWLDPIKTRSLILVGNKKMVSFDDTKPDKVVIFDRAVDASKTRKSKDSSMPSSYQFTFRYGDVVVPYIPNKQPLSMVLDNFINSVTKKEKPLVNSVDAVNMVTLLDAAEHSLKNEGRKINLATNKKTGFISYRKK